MCIKVGLVHTPDEFACPIPKAAGFSCLPIISNQIIGEDLTKIGSDDGHMLDSKAENESTSKKQELIDVCLVSLWMS